MKISNVVIVLTAAAFAAGCASIPTPVPVIGPRPGLSALVGDWSGEYNSPETGRSGSIAFKLEAGKDTAFGSIVMVPRAQYDRVSSGSPVEHPNVVGAAIQKPGELLTIRFVRMEGSHVVGTLDPYRDPDCGCQLATTFRGEFTDESTIEGTFNSAGSEMSHLPTSGRWKVSRVGQ